MPLSGPYSDNYLLHERLLTRLAWAVLYLQRTCPFRNYIFTLDCDHDRKTHYTKNEKQYFIEKISYDRKAFKLMRHGKPQSLKPINR
jgi:uncharacterized UPF0160 family protein